MKRPTIKELDDLYKTNTSQYFKDIEGLRINDVEYYNNTIKPYLDSKRKNKNIKSFAIIGVTIFALFMCGIIGSLTKKESKTKTESPTKTTESSQSKDTTKNLTQQTTNVSAGNSKMPSLENDFLEKRYSFMGKYNSTKEQNKQADIYKETANYTSGFFRDNSYRIKDWYGVIKRIEIRDFSDREQDYAQVYVELIKNNLKVEILSEGTYAGKEDLKKNAIKKGSKIYNRLLHLKAGDEVMFSAIVFPDAKKGIKEISITESGYIDNPEFFVKFINLYKVGSSNTQAEMESTEEIEKEQNKIKAVNPDEGWFSDIQYDGKTIKGVYKAENYLFGGSKTEVRVTCGNICQLAQENPEAEKISLKFTIDVTDKYGKSKTKFLSNTPLVFTNLKELRKYEQYGSHWEGTSYWSKIISYFNSSGYSLKLD